MKLIDFLRNETIVSMREKDAVIELRFKSGKEIKMELAKSDYGEVLLDTYCPEDGETWQE